MSKPQFPEIPMGLYCYGQHGLCPHLITKTVNGVMLPWCNHLKLGSIPPGLSPAEDDLLKEAWGETRYTPEEAEDAVNSGLYKSQDEAHAERWHKTPKEFSLFLLWDQCNECNENGSGPSYWYRGPNEKAVRYPNLIIELAVTAKLPGSLKEQRTFGLWVKVPADASMSQKVRHLLRFLHKVPQHLQRLGIQDAVITHPAVPERRQAVWETAPRFNHVTGKNQPNLVAYAHQILRSLT